AGRDDYVSGPAGGAARGGRRRERRLSARVGSVEEKGRLTVAWGLGTWGLGTVMSRRVPTSPSPHRIIYFLSVTFCARQLQISPTIRSFSVRQSMALTMPNSFGSLPALPNLPATCPFSCSLYISPWSMLSGS